MKAVLLWILSKGFKFPQKKECHHKVSRMSHNMKSQEKVMTLRITCSKRMVTYHRYHTFGIIIKMLFSKTKTRDYFSLTKEK